MAAVPSAWRVNDVVAYDMLRELSTSVQARLLDRLRDGDKTARTELIELRRTTLALDGYNRPAVNELTEQLSRRDTELAQAAAGDS